MEWRNVVGYEGLYEVSSTGLLHSVTRTIEYNSPITPNAVRRTYKGKLISCTTNKLGYTRARLSVGGVNSMRSVHRLVAEAFHPNSYNKPCVNHINEVKDDNRATNLEWCTYSENTQHSVHKITGDNHYKTKLTNDDVLSIVTHLKENIKTQEEIGEFHGTTKQIVCDIKNGRSWSGTTGITKCKRK